MLIVPSCISATRAWNCKGGLAWTRGSLSRASNQAGNENRNLVHSSQCWFHMGPVLSRVVSYSCQVRAHVGHRLPEPCGHPIAAGMCANYLPKGGRMGSGGFHWVDRQGSTTNAPHLWLYSVLSPNLQPLSFALCPSVRLLLCTVHLTPSPVGDSSAKVDG